MAIRKRNNGMVWNWGGRHLAFILIMYLCILAGCSEDNDCPVCPEPSPPVGSPIVPYISYFDRANRDLVCAKKIGDSWGIKIIESSSDVGLFTSIALDAHNNVHISYYQQSSDDLHYAVETQDGWVTEVVDSVDNVGSRTSIAIDAQGNPHISCWNATGNVIRYASRIGGAWNAVDVEGVPAPWFGQCGSGDWGQPTSLAVDAGGIPHISYYSGFNGGSLVHAVKSSAGGTDWSYQVVDDSMNVGIGCSMALDARGNPHISYCEYVKNVRYARMDDDGDWHMLIVPGAISSGRAYPTALALDAGGHPHIAYYTGYGTLAYATKTGSGGWLFEIVDDFGDVGADCSLAVDAEGKPHISYRYWNPANGDDDLKYAVKCDGYWIIETADPWGQKGKYTSIAIGTQ